jgi:uncharacterized protein (DUF1697 family)
MPKHIALLRGINVAGRSMVAMADLKAMFLELEFSDVRTLLQSGNVVFTSERLASPALEKRLETEAEQQFGRHIDFMVRSATEWQAIVESNPFRAEAEGDPGHLVVMCFKDAIKPQAAKAVQTAIRGREIFRASGRNAYIIYPDGIGRSQLTNSLIERTLETRATGRNWNTVLKLAALSAT